MCRKVSKVDKYVLIRCFNIRMSFVTLTISGCSIASVGVGGEGIGIDPSTGVQVVGVVLSD